MRPIVIGTAGHVDHGKTALTRALTGVDTDTLAEERRRGLTIELGFVPLSLPEGQEASIVDVPGHERFLRTMAAGASGVDLVLLAVAADEGFMPQTWEHLAVCALLGVGRVVAALTKADLVPPARLSVLSAQVGRELARAGFPDAPVVPASARTGEGIGALRARLAEAARDCPPRDTRAPFRLHVDRVFTVDGFGTVATGTITAGLVAVGDAVELFPSGMTARVRGLQRHGVSVSRLEAGERAAVNLAGLSHRALRRGDVLAAPGALSPCVWADGRVTLLEDGPTLKNGQRLRLLHGTRELLCRCTLERDTLGPGESGFARLRFEETFAAGWGDRFVLRGLSPAHVLGGGILLDFGQRGKLRAPATLEGLRALERGDPAVRLFYLLGDGTPQRGAALAIAAGLGQEAALAALDTLREEGKIVQLEEFWMLDEALSRLADRAEALLSAYHEAQPLEPGMDRAEFLERLLPFGAEASVSGPLLRELEGRRVLKVRGTDAFLPGFKPKYTPALAKVRDALEVRYRRFGLSPAPNGEVEAAFGQEAAAARQVFRRLERDGVLIALGGEYRVHRVPYLRAFGTFRDLARKGPVPLAVFRDAMGCTRREALRVLERWDADGLTRREGEGRVL